jgi:diaminopimelate dehydrogenase
MELTAVFTRRKPVESLIINSKTPVLHTDDAVNWTTKIDVMILCGGSANDLPAQGPEFAKMFNTVDSFDTHAKIPKYLAEMDKAAVNTTAVISVGWDPGLFSMMRLLSGAILPGGVTNTFWGYGVSQGHSQAIRSLPGVRDAVQYTVPLESAREQAILGEQLSASERHTRECYVVAQEGADCAGIERQIKEMPHYFAGYDTTVTFISQEELLRSHTGMPHGGTVLRTGITGEGHRQTMEFSLKLKSNPEFTASVMVACARAAARLSGEKKFGAKTLFDIPLTYLSPIGRETLIKNLL